MLYPECFSRMFRLRERDFILSVLMFCTWPKSKLELTLFLDLFSVESLDDCCVISARDSPPVSKFSFLVFFRTRNMVIGIDLTFQGSLVF